jgi:hypothetical protein
LLLLLSWVIYERYLQFTLFKKLMQAKQSKEKRRNLIFNQEPSNIIRYMHRFAIIICRIENAKNS